MLIISESGLYALIFRSRKPAAVRFRKWVTQEVLPAIRKNGRYAYSPEGNGEPSLAETKLKMEIRRLENADRRLKIQETNARARIISAANMAISLIGRAGGPRAMRDNASEIYKKAGITIDMTAAHAQGEFDLGASPDQPSAA